MASLLCERPETDHIKEVETLLNEFTQFKYIKQSGLVADKSTKKLARFWLVTLENKQLDIELSDRGFFVEDSFHETLEHLLNQHSAGYVARFQEVLFEKLSKLS